MKNSVIIASFVTLLFCSCGSEFTSVYKYGDQEAKYEFAKEAFARGKYEQAQTLLMELVTMKKGSDESQECLYMLAMSQYCNMDYELASETFKKYTTSYPEVITSSPPIFTSVSHSMKDRQSRVWTKVLLTVPSQPISSSWISSLTLR